MAEDLAWTRRSLKSRKLVSRENVIRQATEQASVTLPTEKFLTSQVTHLKEAWDEYEEAMLKLQEVASQENQDAYKRAFEKVHFDFKMVRQQAETFMERFNKPEAEEEPDYQVLAAAMEREGADCIKDLEDKLADAEGDVEKTATSALWAHIESLLRAVDDKLSRTLISTREAARLAPDRADALHEKYQRVKRDTLTCVRKAR